MAFGGSLCTAAEPVSFELQVQPIMAARGCSQGACHGKQRGQGNVQLASLDHAMWFHRDFRMDDWLLYAIDSPSASNARGFNRGNIFTRNGKLVASVVQEGLIRPI